MSTKQTQAYFPLRKSTMRSADPLTVASKLHLDFLRSGRRQKIVVTEELCKKLLQEDYENAICADTLRHVLKLHSLQDNLQNWERLVELANRGTNLSSEELRRLRALSTLVAI